MPGPFETIIIIAIIIAIISFFTKQKMKEFKVYKHHTKGYKAVKVGIAWLANPLTNPIWFMFRGLWSIFFLYIVLAFIAIGIDYQLYGHISSIDLNNASNSDWLWVGTQFIVIWLPFFKGNDWTANNLVKKGYLFVDSVDAISKKNAIAIALESKTKSRYEENDIQSKPSKKFNKKKVATKSKPSKKNIKNDEAAREFVMETIRNLEYVVTRKTLNKFIKSEENSNDLYAFLYGVALFTWSIHKVKMNYEGFATIFDIVDSALNDSGINIPTHLDLDEDYDEISSGFVDIYSESIGWDSISSDEDLIDSVNQDFQSVGILYARAYSKDDKELSRIYFVKIVNTITENV